MAASSEKAGRKKAVKKKAAAREASPKSAKKAVEKVLGEAADSRETSSSATCVKTSVIGAKSKGASVKKKRKDGFEATRSTLLERRKLLLTSLGKLTDSGSDTTSKPVGDRIDDAVDDVAVDSSYAIAEHEVDELRLVDAALENIEDGTYGACGECGESIDKPRLKALPYAALCLKCKEAEEMEQAKGADFVR